MLSFIFLSEVHFRFFCFLFHIGAVDSFFCKFDKWVFQIFISSLNFASFWLFHLCFYFIIYWFLCRDLSHEIISFPVSSSSQVIFCSRPFFPSLFTSSGFNPSLSDTFIFFFLPTLSANLPCSRLSFHPLCYHWPLLFFFYFIFFSLSFSSFFLLLPSFFVPHLFFLSPRHSASLVLFHFFFHSRSSLCCR